MGRAGLLCLLLAAACVDSNQVHCADGRICAPGNTCDELDHTCISPEQTAACTGLTEGAACTLATIDGVCKNGACEPFVCGDGMRTGTEACDGTDLGSADCTTAGFYNPAGLACTPFCTFDTSACTGKCGDGIINGSELCDGSPPSGTCVDDGFDAGALACSASCGASFAECARFDWDTTPVGIDLSPSVHGLSPTDVYAAGVAETPMQHGVIAHWDGVRWSATTLAYSKLIHSIFETAPGEAWAVGDDTVFHLTAGQWSAVTGPLAGAYRVVFGLGTSSLYVGGSTGVQHFDGTQWSAVGSLANVVSLSGAAESDLWAVLANGTVQHWDGTAWQQQTLAATITAVTAAGADEAWAIGTSTTDPALRVVEHVVGGTWTEHSEPNTSGSYKAIAVRHANDVWVAVGSGAVERFDGISWNSTVGDVTAGSEVVALVVVGNELYGMTSAGTVVHNNGITQVDMMPNELTHQAAIWSVSPQVTYVGATGNVALLVDDTWSDITCGASLVIALWGASSTDAWAAETDNKLYHFDGASWTVHAYPYTDGINAIWGSSATDVWFFGPEVVHWIGGTFRTDATITEIVGVAASSGNDIWALGLPSFGATTTTPISHWNGTTWTAHTVPYQVQAITVTPAGDAYAVTGDSHVLSWNGTAWFDTGVAPLTHTPQAISATAPDDIFAASNAELAFFDGTQWSPIREPTASPEDIVTVDAHRGYVDVVMSLSAGTPQPVFRISRQHPWNCRAHETDCSDGVDDDCDGLIDSLDPDCP